MVSLNDIKINGKSLEGINYYIGVKSMLYLTEYFKEYPDNLIDKESFDEIKKQAIKDVKIELKLPITEE